MPNQFGCLLYLYWESPSNTAAQDLTAFIFHYDNGSILFNQTSGDNTAVISYECTCNLANHIFITAINRCNSTSRDASFKLLDEISPYNCHHCCPTTNRPSTDPPSNQSSISDKPTTHQPSTAALTSQIQSRSSTAEADTTTQTSTADTTSHQYSTMVTRPPKDNDNQPADNNSECHLYEIKGACMYTSLVPKPSLFRMLVMQYIRCCGKGRVWVRD